MSIQDFFKAVYEFLKNLLSYLGKWPIPEVEEEETV
mgnify:CR=1 FL=1